MTQQTERPLSDADFVRLLDFRDGLRRFLRWSEAEAKRVGLTASQHQLLLAVRGHRAADGARGGIRDRSRGGPACWTSRATGTPTGHCSAG